MSSLRLLTVEGSDGARGGHVTYHVQALQSSGNLTACDDVTGAATANGTTVKIWTCNGGANQRWHREARSLEDGNAGSKEESAAAAWDSAHQPPSTCDRAARPGPPRF